MKTQTIMQIALLDDVLSKTSALCLLLQSDKMDFRAVSRAIEFTVSRLECMITVMKRDLLQSFTKSSDNDQCL